MGTFVDRHEDGWFLKLRSGGMAFIYNDLSGFVAIVPDLVTIDGIFDDDGSARATQIHRYTDYAHNLFSELLEELGEAYNSITEVYQV